MNPEDFETAEEAAAQIAADRRIKEANAEECCNQRSAYHPWFGIGPAASTYGATERAQDRASALVHNYMNYKGELPDQSAMDRILAIVRAINDLDVGPGSK